MTDEPIGLAPVIHSGGRSMGDPGAFNIIPPDNVVLGPWEVPKATSGQLAQPPINTGWVVRLACPHLNFENVAWRTLVRTADAKVTYRRVCPHLAISLIPTTVRYLTLRVDPLTRPPHCHL